MGVRRRLRGRALPARRPPLGARGILYDRTAAIAEARRADLLALRDRCTFAEGDFLARVPPADAIVLSRVLHDWPDSDCERILANCRAALPPGGRIAIHESLIEPGNAPDFGKLLDLEMLVMTTGRERTRLEFESLFARSGLRLTGVIPFASGAIVEAAPV